MSPRVMGIVNVTPDSFSDGGRFDRPEAARAHAAGAIVIVDNTTLTAVLQRPLDLGGPIALPCRL